MAQHAKDKPATGNGGASSDYQHADQAVQRPGVGVQQEFQGNRPPKAYRFDSSISPDDAKRKLKLPCWMLDTDYNGLVFTARQVFFPKTAAWNNPEKSLRGRFEPGVWGHLAGTESEPFPVGEHQRIAVTVIDERGNELMVVKGLAK